VLRKVMEQDRLREMECGWRWSDGRMTELIG
jgi:hypothetical protein